MTGQYFSRTVDGQPEETWQRLSDHLAGVAERAAEFAAAFGFSEWGSVAGLVHDLGKYSDEFQHRLRDQRIRVDHSTAGAKWLIEAAKERGGHEAAVGKLLAFAVAGHHAGLPDGLSAEDSCLTARLRRATPVVPGNVAPPATTLPGARTLANLCMGRTAASDSAFGLAFFVRMLFACLVDADRLDAEAFGAPDDSARRAGAPALEYLRQRLARHMSALTTDAPSTLVNGARNEVLRACQEAAKHAPGLFSLTVPTGGGKTLASLTFALEHARMHGMRRVIYVIPYTSIIEQNAAVFRRVLGDDAVIEHHSSVEVNEREGGERSRIELATENWDGPVIVTTSVQFYESLFSDRPSRCRKLHNIANSVVILDEAHLLPPHLLLPSLMAVRELAKHYHSSVVLCTATQPAVLKRDDFKHGLENVREIMPHPADLYRRLRRTKVVSVGVRSLDQLAEALRGERQVLCVVNTKRRARALFDALLRAPEGFHLSAAMCPAHRTLVLAEVRRRLSAGESCRLVSTQVVEAGVDIDFPVLLRESAGLDSIAQAAGRCNREGKLDGLGRVEVFESEDGVPRMFRQQAQVAQGIARRHEDLLGLAAVHDYFADLYWVKGDDELDRERVLACLAEAHESLDFPFREVGERYRLIKDGTSPVFIRFDDDACRLGEQLRATGPNRGLMRKAQRYMVNAYPHEVKTLQAARALQVLFEGFSVLVAGEYYDQNTGLVATADRHPDPEMLIT